MRAGIRESLYWRQEKFEGDDERLTYTAFLGILPPQNLRVSYDTETCLKLRRVEL